MSHVKRFKEPLTAIQSNHPATARVLVEVRVNGEFLITSTLGEPETVDLLDKAMEAIDGQRLPPEGK